MTPAEERHQLEVAKLKAEIAKAIAEKREIDNRLNQPWYQNPQFIQAIAAGVVAMPLVWFYVQEVALPSLTADELEQQIETLTSRRELNITIDNLRRDLTQAKTDNQATVTALENAQTEIEQLKQQIVTVSEQSRQLATQQPDPASQQQLNDAADQAEAVAETLTTDVLPQLAQEQQTARERSETLDDQLERLTQPETGSPTTVESGANGGDASN